MAEKLIKNPNTESAYQFVPEQVPTVQSPVSDTTDQLIKNPDAESPYQFIPGQAPATPTTGQEEQVTTPAADSAPAPTTPVAEQPTADATGTAPAPTIPVADNDTTPTTPVADGAPAPTTPAADASSAAVEGIDPSQYTFTGKQLEQMGPAVEEEPGKPQYLTDWSKVDNVYEEAKRLNLPLAQVLQDYQRWGNETGKPTYWINSMFQDSDLSKSVADNEAEKKKQERKEKWDKVGNFLLHLGNAIGNVGGGGYASMKLEDPVHWSERQRQLKEKGLEQRRLNNQSIIQQMHKNWADERANRVQQQNYEMKQRELNLKEDTQKHKEYMDSYKIKIAQQKFDYQKEKDKLDRELKAKQISQKDYALRIAALNASVNEYRAYNPVTTTTTKTDSRGRKSTTESVQSRGGNAGSGNKGNGYGGGTQKGKGY